MSNITTETTIYEAQNCTEASDAFVATGYASPEQIDYSKTYPQFVDGIPFSGGENANFSYAFVGLKYSVWDRNNPGEEQIVDDHITPITQAIGFAKPSYETTIDTDPETGEIRVHFHYHYIDGKIISTRQGGVDIPPELQGLHDPWPYNK